ncbi:MAG: DUF3293 domain-containing protein [Bacteroidota bacterium]
MNIEDDSLLNSFLRTAYVLFPDGETILKELCIRIGDNNHQLLPILQTMNLTDWAFITAWNPQVQALSRTENEERNQQLEKDLMPYAVFRGEGRPQLADDWEAEQSFWVPGIAEEEAIRLGRKYNQRAIIQGKWNQARLVWL